MVLVVIGIILCCKSPSGQCKAEKLLRVVSADGKVYLLIKGVYKQDVLLRQSGSCLAEFIIIQNADTMRYKPKIGKLWYVFLYRFRLLFDGFSVGFFDFGNRLDDLVFN